VVAGKAYVFNFCQYVNNPCGTNNASYAYRQLFAGAGGCNILTDGEYEPDVVETIAFNSTGTNVSRHIKFQQAGGYVCNANGTKASINFEIFCDETKNSTPTA